MKKYDVVLANSQTHTSVAIVTITADGYLSALTQAHKVCQENHPGLYVVKVETTKG